MKSFFQVMTKVAPLVLIVLFSCSKDEPTAPASTVAQLIGTVRDSLTNAAIGQAGVQLSYGTTIVNTTSNPLGVYALSTDLGTTTATTGILQVSRSTYNTSTFSVSLVPGSTLTYDVRLYRDTSVNIGATGQSGLPNTIAFTSASTSQLAVYGVGGLETSIITYEVRDSLGKPISDTNADTVFFFLTGAPTGGGAYVAPQVVVSNAAGRVSTTVNSGTVAGTAQLIAQLYRDVDGLTIRSTPVRLIVHGGLPDQAHFSLGANPFNVPGFYVIGATSSITALVGDQYGNPVAPNTAVYFTTTQGVITTSTGFTAATGFATVTLYTGNPLAVNGIGTVTARTIGVNSSTVTSGISVLFSGHAFIDSLRVIGGLDDTIRVSSTGQAVVGFRVYDERFNPLALGTAITAEVKGGASAVASDASPTNTLPDAISSYWTDFRIIVSKDLTVVPPVNGPFTLTITVTGPNGTAKANLQGIVN